MICVRLPFPPSANHYNALRVVTIKGKQVPMHYRTKRAKAFYDAVGQVVVDCCQVGLEGRLRLTIELSPPTRRTFDISNAVKCIEDALAEAGAFINDSQIDELYVKRLPKDDSGTGCADVTIEEIP